MLRRRTARRWVASLLLAISPALGGQATVLHQCTPAHSAPPSAELAMAGMHHHAGHTSSPTQHDPHHSDCNLCCQHAAAAVTVPRSTAIVTCIVTHRAWVPVHNSGIAAAQIALLPESTAPPLVS